MLTGSNNLYKKSVLFLFLCSITSGWANSSINKCTFQNSSYMKTLSQVKSTNQIIHKYKTKHAFRGDNSSICPCSKTKNGYKVTGEKLLHVLVLTDAKQLQIPAMTGDKWLQTYGVDRWEATNSCSDRWEIATYTTPCVDWNCCFDVWWLFD